MGKYLVLWETDWSKIQIDAKERSTGGSLLLAMVKHDMKAGLTKDWGQFVGEMKGYSIVEGNEVEVSAALSRYAPWVKFKTYPILSVPQAAETMKSLTK